MPNGAFLIKSLLFRRYNVILWFIFSLAYKSVFRLYVVAKGFQILDLEYIVEHHGAYMVHPIVDAGNISTYFNFPDYMPIGRFSARQAFAILSYWVSFLFTVIASVHQ